MLSGVRSKAWLGFTASTLDVLSETLLSLTDEDEELIFLYRNDIDTFAFRLCEEVSLELAGWNEERFRHSLPMFPSGLQEAARFQPRGLRLIRRDHGVAEDEATRCIHETDAIEGTILLSLKWFVIDPEGDPGFIDLKLVRMQHGRCLCEA